MGIFAPTGHLIHQDTVFFYKWNSCKVLLCYLASSHTEIWNFDKSCPRNWPWIYIWTCHLLLCVATLGWKTFDCSWKSWWWWSCGSFILCHSERPVSNLIIRFLVHLLLSIALTKFILNFVVVWIKQLQTSIPSSKGALLLIDYMRWLAVQLPVLIKKGSHYPKFRGTLNLEMCISATCLVLKFRF